jgi:uncharacterized membrane protein
MREQARGIPGVVWVLMGGYVAVYLGISLVKWYWFLYDDFDLAIYAHACRRAVRGSLYSPILNVNLLGNHMSVLILPISLIYAVVPSPVTLLALQTVVLALGALPVYWLAQRELRNEAIAVCFAAVYLLYPALGYTNLYQFHPETLTTTTLLFAFYFLRTARFGWMTLFATLSLTAKEDVPLPVAALGLYALTLSIPRRWLYSATLLGLAVASLVLAFVVVMPAVNRGEVQMQKIYAQWGETTGQALVTMMKSPGRVVRELASTPGDPADTTVKRQYHLQILMPVMFLALLSPLTFGIALPSVAQHLLSGRPNDHSIVYHYTACVTPFVVAASVLGLRNLLSVLARRRPGPLPARDLGARRAVDAIGVALAVTAIALGITCQLLFGPVAGFGILQQAAAVERNAPTPEQRAQAPHLREMLGRVPARGAVASGFRFLPYVVNRDVVYSVHHVYGGAHTMSDKPYAIPEDVVAMLLDADSWNYLSFSRSDGGARLRKLLEVNRLVPVDAAGDAVLFLRDATDPMALVEVGDGALVNRRRVDYSGQISFVGWDEPAPFVARGGRLTLRTFWRRTGAVDRYYLTQFAFFDGEGRENALPPRRLGYTIWPPHDWRGDAVIAETYRLVVPGNVPDGIWTLGVRVIEQGARSLVLARVDDEDLRATRFFIPLGQVTVGPENR